jgi:hypothetical protein
MLPQSHSLDYEKISYQTKASPVNHTYAEVMWIFVNRVEIKKGNYKSSPNSTKKTIISNQENKSPNRCDE